MFTVTALLIHDFTRYHGDTCVSPMRVCKICVSLYILVLHVSDFILIASCNWNRCQVFQVFRNFIS